MSVAGADACIVCGAEEASSANESVCGCFTLIVRASFFSLSHGGQCTSAVVFLVSVCVAYAKKPLCLQDDLGEPLRDPLDDLRVYYCSSCKVCGW